MRDVRLNRDAECEKHKRPEELKVDELMGEAEGAGGKVAEDLLVNEDNIVDAGTFEEETSDANREVADKERDEGKRKMDSGEEKRNQDNKRRRLQLLVSEKKLCARLTPLVLSMRCRVQMRVLMMRMQRLSAGE